MRDVVSSHAVATSSSVITVTWKGEADIEEDLAKHYGYQVQYKLATDNKFLVAVNVSHVYDVTTYNATVTGLSHNTVYTVRVAMYRQLGDLFGINMTSSQDIYITTLCIGGCVVTLFDAKFYSFCNQL